MPSTPFHSATELASRIRRGDVSPVTVVDECLDRIEASDRSLNAFVTVLDEEARERAKAAERAVESGQELGPLHGVPLALKDLFDFKAGVVNTMGSTPFEDFVPGRSATYVERLEAAGAIVVGKTNTPEFGHKGTTDNRVLGPTRTPWDLDRNAGGSSGGSAAAVAGGLVPVAQGSDAGGSIRIPAAFCGVYGLKPTYGRVAQESRPDAFGSHTPMLHSGPITRTVEDAAMMLDVMSGYHPRDPFSVPGETPDFVGSVRRGIEGYEIAYSPAFEIYPVSDPVRSVVDEAIGAFRDAGATVDRVELGIDCNHRELTDLWLRQTGSLYNAMLEDFKATGVDLLGDHRSELCDEFVDMVEQTADRSVASYKQDERTRTAVFDAIQDVFDEFDLLVTPTVAVPPVENVEDPERQTLGPTAVAGEPVDSRIGWCLTVPLNLTGHPAASIPAGLTDEQLPVGLQVIGDRFSEVDVLAASGAFERVRPWTEPAPPW